jgi:hypothetical protein
VRLHNATHAITPPGPARRLHSGCRGLDAAKIARAIGRDCGEQAGFAAGLLAGTIGSSDALSERGIAALVRLRGKRRVGGCAGSIISSNVAFRGSTPDPFPDGDRSLKHHFSLRKVAPPASCRGASDLGQLRTRRLGRVRPVAACRAAQRSTSGLSQTSTRPLPKLRTGRGISGYRCW